jgi:hypothetical protein
LLELSDGLIHRSSHNFNAEEFFTLSEGAFIGWMDLNHPEDLAAMLDDRPFPFAPVRLTPDSIALWELHLAQYLAEQV